MDSCASNDLFQILPPFTKEYLEVFFPASFFNENNALLLLSNRTFLFHFSKSDQSLYCLQHSKLGTERVRGVKRKMKNL